MCIRDRCKTNLYVYCYMYMWSHGHIIHDLLGYCGLLCGYGMILDDYMLIFGDMSWCSMDMSWYLMIIWRYVMIFDDMWWYLVIMWINIVQFGEYCAINGDIVSNCSDNMWSNERYLCIYGVQWHKRWWVWLQCDMKSMCGIEQHFIYNYVW